MKTEPVYPNWSLLERPGLSITLTLSPRKPDYGSLEIRHGHLVVELWIPPDDLLKIETNLRRALAPKVVA